jgi:hypothetical protein
MSISYTFTQASNHAAWNGAVMTSRCPFQFTSFIRFPEQPRFNRFFQPRELQVIPKNGFNSKGSFKAGFSLAKIVGFTINLF